MQIEAATISKEPLKLQQIIDSTQCRFTKVSRANYKHHKRELLYNFSTEIFKLCPRS